MLVLYRYLATDTLNVYMTSDICGFRYLILDHLKAPVDHFKFAMFKLMEVLFFILVQLLERLADSLWVIK